MNKGSKQYIANTDILKNTVMQHTCKISVQIVYNSVTGCWGDVSPHVSNVLTNTYLTFSHQINLAAAEQQLHGLLPLGGSWKCLSDDIASLSSDLLRQFSERMAFTMLDCLTYYF